MTMYCNRDHTEAEAKGTVLKASSAGREALKKAYG